MKPTRTLVLAGIAAGAATVGQAGAAAPRAGPR